ncbi:MAG: serine/threonine-protein kinase, partial [Pirellulales bacterium]
MSDSPQDDSPFARLLARHRQAMEQNETLDLEQLIASLERALSDDEIWQILEQEMVFRLRQGRRVEAAEYSGRFPKLANRVTMFLNGATQSLTAKPSAAADSHAAPSPSASGTKAMGAAGSTVGRTTLPSSAKHLAPGVLFGDYEILSVLGRGGMGIVYQARHRATGGVCALKTVAVRGGGDEEMMRRFRRESRTAQRLAHPNIVAGIDAGDVDGVPYLALEYVAGPNLSDLIKQSGPLPLRQALHYIIQAGRGLAYAHEQGVVHRDVKPSNMLVDETSGEVKLLDLGLAQAQALLSDATRSADLTSTGAMFGTVDFMAPEQALDAKRVDGRADIYSLGCTLHYLLTGRMAFGGDTVLQKIRLHRDGAVPRIKESRAEIPDALDNAFQRMMAKRPEDRFPTMSETIAALERVEEVIDGSRADEAPITISLQSVARLQKKPASRRKLWIGGSLALGALFAVGLIGWRLSRPSPTERIE